VTRPLHLDLKHRFPSLSDATANTIARSFYDRGIEAVLAATDTDLDAAIGMGPKRIAEFRSVWPSPWTVSETPAAPMTDERLAEIEAVAQDVDPHWMTVDVLGLVDEVRRLRRANSLLHLSRGSSEREGD
jgi:hypothetical protein